MSKGRKETLAFLYQVALCAEQAANKTEKHREYQELRRCITRQEREHRAMGRRLVGNISARMTVDQSVDYFVAKVLAQGAKLHKVSELVGLREDFVRGAILMHDQAFAESFLAYTAGSFPGLSEAAIARSIEAVDYSTLVGS